MINIKSGVSEQFFTETTKKIIMEMEEKNKNIFNKTLRVAIASEMIAGGYDMSKGFNKAFVAGFSSSFVNVNGVLTFKIKNDMDYSHKIITKWKNKDGSEYSVSITVGEIIDIIENGRSEYKIISKNTKHGMLAFTPGGKGYDPNNKSNVIIKNGVAQVNPKPGVGVFATATELLEDWVAELEEYFINRMTSEFTIFIKGLV